MKETTVFPGNFEDGKKYSNVSLTQASNNHKFNATFSASFVIDDNNLLQIDPTAHALYLPPDAPELYDSSGNINWGTGEAFFYNPLFYFSRKYRGNTSNLISNLTISYNLFSWLQLKTNLGYTQTVTQEDLIFPIKGYPPFWGITKGSAEYSNSQLKSWIAEPQLQYQQAGKKWRVTALAGLTFLQNKMNATSYYASGYTDDALLHSIAAASSISVLEAKDTKYRYDAIFGKINYEWNEKYLINLTGRRDGSSRFGNDKRFSNFGAVGLAWIFTKEPGIQRTLKWLSFGKLRSSWGITGNDQIGDYQYLDTYSPTTYPYQGISSLFPTRLYNPDFTWEKNEKKEIALQLGFAKERILFSAAYYRNRSSNQLVGYPLPLITGGSSIEFNLPAIVQNTGWEFEATARLIDVKPLRWNTSFNLTVPRNKLVRYPNLSTSGYANRYVEGQSLYIRKLYHYTGVDQQTGLYQFQNVVNGGNTSKPAYPDDLLGLKSTAIDFFGGFQNSFEYKNWSLDIFMQFVKQTGWNYLAGNSGGKFSDYAPGMIANQPVEVLKRWQKPGDQSNIQKFTQTYNEAYTSFSKATGSDEGISDCSFIRMKNISLAYMLPETIIHNLHIQYFKIYAQCQNLFTITNYPGLDPENQLTGNLPPLRVITAGFQLTF
jgi:hypothetical protein